ncbi:ABC transporter permease [Arthrobacter echini]|uniref:Transport permease protein n=1 Tax=Arthrobacter echini TaxID=1529066 RepID=A0A4S5E8K6_9MICC|nr:ABC transporter permease [Arthrobacter echini]THJ67968.1 ABC transporter permease [Arthrobacter echini]
MTQENHHDLTGHPDERHRGTRPQPEIASRHRRATVELLRSEARLYLRDGPAATFALLIPALVLVGTGLVIPGMRTTVSAPGTAWDGLPMIQTFTPSVLTMALATPALSTLPVVIATYRERGVLRRLSTTPARPASLLIVQVAINVGAFLVAAVLALSIAAMVFGSPAPRQLAVAGFALVLGAVAVFGLGLLVAARVRTGTAASGVGMLLYFPLLFLAGMWTPGPLMPEWAQTIATWTPAGAVSQALNSAWFATEVPALQLVVLAGWTMVLYPIAARIFRWT